MSELKEWPGSRCITKFHEPRSKNQGKFEEGGLAWWTRALWLAKKTCPCSHIASSMPQIKFTLCNLHGWRNCQHRACIGKSFLATKRGSPSPCEASLFFFFFFTCSVPGLQPCLLALLSLVFVWQHWLHTPGIYGVGKGEGSGILGEQHAISCCSVSRL